jgi:adenylate cyclase
MGSVDEVQQGAEEDPANRAGKVDVVRRLLARKAAEIIRSDPEEAAVALEIGLIDNRWLEDPVNRPISTSRPTDIIEQFLARSVERKPLLLSKVGLSAVQLLAAHRTPAGGEVRAVTVAFTDLEGFTTFTDTNGDNAAVELVREQHRMARPVVRRFGGRVIKELGDGLLCIFNDAGSGVLAALELLETSQSPLRLRAGLHVGEAVVSRDDVVGHVVNVAARVTDTARGDQVVVTAETAELAGPIPDVEFRKLRSRRLKGISERAQLRQAIRLT